MKTKTNRDKWYEYADSNKIPKSIAHSPIDRILFKFNICPIFFWKFYYLVAILWIQFSFFYGLIMYLWVWRDRTIIISILSAIATGLLFGISMSMFIIWRRRKWNLKWEDIISD